jgi:hypothetical protein
MAIPDHSYEEIRKAAVDLLAGRDKSLHMAPETRQYATFLTGVADVLERREGRGGESRHHTPSLSNNDRELFREVFWELFRQGVITLGLNDSNREFPHFSLSHFGKKILDNENTYFFHDLSTYTALIQSNVPNINPTTLLYLQEAMQSFKAGCLLAATVMLGVASEHSFLLLADVTEKNGKYGLHFSSVSKERMLLHKFTKYKAALETQVAKDLPKEIKENLGIEFDGILSLIRTFRNEAGHPTGKILGREQTYVLLQLFIPYCKKLYQLIDFFR